MTYTLTLTAGERRAIDWIGHRYSNGHQLFLLLFVESNCSPDYVDWDTHGSMYSLMDITFTVPEHVAWQIRDNAENEDGSWPCFAPELAAKMQQFVDSVV